MARDAPTSPIGLLGLSRCGVEPMNEQAVLLYGNLKIIPRRSAVYLGLVIAAAGGRGNFLQLSRAANGDIVSNGILSDARTDNLLQTDFNIRRAISVAEGKKLSLEANIINALNQRAGVNYVGGLLPTGLVSPTRASRFSGDPLVDWGKVMNGYNPIDAVNATGAFAGVQSKLRLANRYGLPQVFQTARNIRLAIKFSF